MVNTTIEKDRNGSHDIVSTHVGNSLKLLYNCFASFTGDHKFGCGSDHISSFLRLSYYYTVVKTEHYALAFYGPSKLSRAFPYLNLIEVYELSLLFSSVFLYALHGRRVREAFNIVDDGDDIAEIIIDLYYNTIVYPFR